MSEHEPTMRIPLSNGEFLEADRFNSRLFSFLGRTALDGVEMDSNNFDHVYIVTSEEEDHQVGSFVFGRNPVTGEVMQNYLQMAEFMATHKFPMSLNNSVVPSCDQEAYKRFRENCINEAVENINFDELLGE